MEETISSVLNKILSLPDIPELESRRLNLLCKRLDALKDLFILEAGEAGLFDLVMWPECAYFDIVGVLRRLIRSLLVQIRVLGRITRKQTTKPTVRPALLNENPAFRKRL